MTSETSHKPAAPGRDHVLSILRTGRNTLAYLTPNDWALIIDRGKRLIFKKSEKLLCEGKQQKLLYVLVTGGVSVAVSGIKIAQIGPGEVCGDMAFLEHSVASATATAEEEVETYALE
jgi:CRP/FNR family transcriptional regulator, cyclic AMP receptor protein